VDGGHPSMTASYRYGPRWRAHPRWCCTGTDANRAVFVTMFRLPPPAPCVLPPPTCTGTGTSAPTPYSGTHDAAPPSMYRRVGRHSL